MRKLKKLTIALVVAMISVVWGIQIVSNAEDKLKALNYYADDQRIQWPLEFGDNIGLSVNHAIWRYDNAYCIQHGYDYDHNDTFNIRYGIEIDGNTAYLYEGSFDGGYVKSYTHESNNVLGIILTPEELLPEEAQGIRNAGEWEKKGIGYTDGFQLGIAKALDSQYQRYSQAQRGLWQYWDTWEKNVGQNLGLSDFGFTSESSYGETAVADAKMLINTYNLSAKVKFIILETTKPTIDGGHQNVIATDPDGPEVEPTTKEITVTKKWANSEHHGNQPEKVTVELYKDGAATGKTLDLTAPDWSATFTELEEGYEYTIVEKNVPDCYESTIAKESNGYVITNTLKSTSLTVSKVWDDEDDRDGLRPEKITIVLKANGETYKTQEITGTGNTWSYTFEDLPTHIDGEAVTYTAEEIVVEGYNTTIENTKTE